MVVWKLHLQGMDDFVKNHQTLNTSQSIFTWLAFHWQKRTAPRHRAETRGFVKQHGRGDSGNSKASNQRAGHPGTTMLMVYHIYIYIHLDTFGIIWTGIEV